MKFIVSLLISAVLCSAVFAQETTSSAQQKTPTKAQLKEQRDARIAKGKTAAARAQQKRKKQGKEAALEKQMKAEKKKQ